MKTTLKLLHFRRLTSNLFHSVIVDGKKEFLKNLCLLLKQGILSEFLGECVILAGIKQIGWRSNFETLMQKTKLSVLMTELK